MGLISHFLSDFIQDTYKKNVESSPTCYTCNDLLACLIIIIIDYLYNANGIYKNVDSFDFKKLLIDFLIERGREREKEKGEKEK